MICRHCCKAKVRRPRGLCWDCYYRPGVRELYPSKNPFTAAGRLVEFDGPAPVPDRPCPHPPGSEGRIRTLEERVARREGLWRPDDATYEGSR